MSTTFVLNDETKLNSHGFRTKNSGIDLSRFKENPVLLDFHENSNKAVIGRWENLRIQGSQLLADAVFDKEDEQAKAIAGKVERGFLKGASMGLAIKDSEWRYENGEPVLANCELTEASICAIPSNAKALKLYNKDGELLTGEQITLAVNNKNNNKTDKMNKLQLSSSSVEILGLSAEQNGDLRAIETAIRKLEDERANFEIDLSFAQAELSRVKGELKKIQEVKASELVDEALKSGKIDGDKKAYFLKFATDDFKTCKEILAGLPTAQQLSAVQSEVDNPFNVKTMDDFQKLSHADKVAFKNEYAEEYLQIVTR